MSSLQTIKQYAQNRHFLAGLCVVVSVILGMVVLAQNQHFLSAKSQVKVTDSATSSPTQEMNNDNQTAAANRQNTPTTSSDVQDSATTSNQQTDRLIETKQVTDPQTLFSNLSLSAESVVVWNQADNKVIYQQASQKEQPLASLTKLMTALVVKENTQASTTATVTDQHLKAFGEYGLQAGEKWPIDELITFMLVSSANDAARAVASATVNAPNDGYASEFVDMMNRTANRLGLSDTYFFNPSGLDINEELISGGYSTAQDAVKLFDYITTNHPDLLTPTTKPEVQVRTSSGKQYTADNTNDDIKRYTNSYGSKTGYTVLAGGNLVMGFQLDEPIIIAVFGSTKQGRFTDMQQLYQATKQYLTVTN
jgi:D-alanyl-D-alanine carboxypeptidase